MKIKNIEVFIFSLMIIGLLPIFIFRSDAEFYLTSILWGDNLKNSIDFLEAGFSMAKLSYLINILSLIKNPLLAEGIQVTLVIGSISVIIISLYLMFKKIFIYTNSFWYYISLLLLLNPQASHSANRFITDHAHPRLLSLAFLLITFVLLLKRTKGLYFTLTYFIATLLHPISALIVLPIIINLIFLDVNTKQVAASSVSFSAIPNISETFFLKKERVSFSKLSKIFLLFLGLFFYYGSFKLFSNYHVTASAPITGLVTDQWASVLQTTMGFIFPIHLFNDMGILVETILALLAFLFFDYLHCFRFYKLLLYVVFLTVITTILYYLTHWVFFLQIQPLRAFNIINLFILLMAAGVDLSKIKMKTRVMFFTVLLLWIFIRPTETNSYQIIKLSGVLALSLLFYFCFKMPQYRFKISLVSCLLIWFFSLNLNWMNGKIYEIYGKAFSVIHYNEDESIKEVVNWVRNQTSNRDAFSWCTDDERGGLFRLLSGRPTFVTKKDGGIVLYSPQLAQEWKNRMQEVKDWCGQKNWRSDEIQFIIATKPLNLPLSYQSNNKQFFIYKNANK